MTGITAESFILKNKCIKKRNPRKHLHFSRKKESPAPPLYLIDPLELATFTGTILKDHHIVIHKNVDQSKQIAAMAVAMGATLLTEGVDDLSYATDLVICGTEHTVRPRLIHQAQERHIRIVSPLWIVSCFREQIYKDPYLFPYHMDNIRNTLALSSDVNEDPFHITHIEEERNHVFENSSHGRRSESPDTFSPSLPPQTPPRESKNPKPSRGVSAILNNQSFIDLVKKKQLEKQDEHLIRKDERRGYTSHRINKHPRKSTLFEKNGLAIWYTDKKK